MTDEHSELRRALDQVRVRVNADTAAILVLDDAKSHLEPVLSIGLDRTTRLATRVPLGHGFAGRVAQLREPVVIDRVTRDNVLNPIIHAHEVRSLLGVPLVDQDLLVGVLHVGTRGEREFTASDVDLLTEAATGIARTIRALSLDEERTAAIVLQRSLLPSEPVSIPGLEVAARYLPAEGDLGGDWYDSFALPGGRLGVVMGDVVGHGLHSAVVMGRLRSALRAYALDHDDPATVLERLDRNIQHFEPGVLATLLYGVVDADRTEIVVSCAGHWPPVVLGADGTGRPGLVRSDVLMGVEPERRRTTSRVPLEPGGLVCLFTDGLVERRDEDDPALAVKRLMTSLSVEGDAAANVRAAIGELVAQDVIEDDVAVLIMKITD